LGISSISRHLREVEGKAIASIWRHPKSPFFTACWRDADGKQRRISTKTSDKKLAKRIAHEFEAATRKKRTLAQLEKVLRSFHEELNGETSQARSLRSFCEEWLAEKHTCIAPATFKFYSTSINKLYTYFGERADQPISAVTRGDLVKFRNQIAADLSAGTVNHDLTVTRMVFADARRRGALTEDPAEGIKPVRERDQAAAGPPRRAFTIPELQAIIGIADAEWQSMIRIGLYSGGRLGDVALLRWSNVDLSRGELRFVARKTGKAVCVPIGAPLREVLLSLPTHGDVSAYLHPGAAVKVNRKGSSASLSQEFGELLERAGLRPAYQRPNGNETGPRSQRHRMNALSYHSLRHTAVSLLKDAGIAQATVQELVGHSSEQMSARYTHVGSESMQRAAAAFPII
jgi:integrase